MAGLRTEGGEPDAAIGGITRQAVVCRSPHSRLLAPSVEEAGGPSAPTRPFPSRMSRHTFGYTPV